MSSCSRGPTAACCCTITALGPFRVLKEEEWMRRWDDAGRWTLLVLPSKPSTAPPTSRAETGTEGAATASPANTACGGLVRPALDLAAAGDVESAKGRLAAAAGSCVPVLGPPAGDGGPRVPARALVRGGGAGGEGSVPATPTISGLEARGHEPLLAGQPDKALGAWNQIAEPSLRSRPDRGPRAHAVSHRSTICIDGSSGELLTAVPCGAPGVAWPRCPPCRRPASAYARTRGGRADRRWRWSSSR